MSMDFEEVRLSLPHIELAAHLYSSRGWCAGSGAARLVG